MPTGRCLRRVSRFCSRPSRGKPSRSTTRSRRRCPIAAIRLKEITLVPAPERLQVECWQPIQSGSERAFDFMAKYGISGVIGGGSAEGGAVERHMIGFQQAYARRGV